MHITMTTVPIRDVVSGYEDNDDKGVAGLDGRLDIRPAYQRAFVYSDAKQVPAHEHRHTHREDTAPGTC